MPEIADPFQVNTPTHEHDAARREPRSRRAACRWAAMVPVAWVAAGLAGGAAAQLRADQGAGAPAGGPVERGVADRGANAASQRVIDPGNDAFAAGLLYEAQRDGFGMRMGWWNNAYDRWYVYREPGVRMVARGIAYAPGRDGVTQAVGADSFFDLRDPREAARDVWRLEDRPVPAAPWQTYWEGGERPAPDSGVQRITADDLRLGLAARRRALVDQAAAGAMRVGEALRGAAAR